LVGQGTLGLRQLSSPSSRFLVAGLFRLTLTVTELETKRLDLAV